MFEFWNEMLVSNIRCKNLSKKALSFRTFSRILRREGWEINDLSPFSWQFLWNFMTFGLFFKGLKFLKQTFVSRKLKYLNFDIIKYSFFSGSCLSQKTYYRRKLIVFSCLQFADCYIWQRICLVVWFLCFNHYYGIFLKSFPSRNHGVVENLC